MKYVINGLKVAGFIGLALACNVIPMILLRQQGNMSLSFKWLSGGLYIVFLILSMRLVWHYYQKIEHQNRSRQKIGWRDLGISLLFWLGARVIAVVGSLTNHIFTGQTTSANDATLASMTSLFDKGFLLYTILYLLAIAFVAPFMEELAYRALPAELFFEGRLKALTGLVTSILFGLPHASNLPEFIMYSLIGAVLYLAYQRRGNIKDAILLHVLNNLPAALYFLWLAFQ